MFNGNRGREERTAGIAAAAAASNKRGMFSVIGSDVVITGNITATADLHVDGRIEGDVHCGSLAQGAESRIFGNVHAETARLAGNVEGTVHARTLTIERTARIVGDVEYESITIEQGGHVDGRLKHVQPGVEAIATPLRIANDAAA